MKRNLLVLVFCLIASFAFAGASGEIVAVDKDDNGNIRVWVQYKVDGIEVNSRYPKIDGKSVYCSRYHVFNFAGMSDVKIKEHILKDVDTHTKALIRQTFIKKLNKDIYDNHLKNIIASKATNETTTVKIDMDKDGVVDEEWILKTDGTKTVSPITPTP